MEILETDRKEWSKPRSWSKQKELQKNLDRPSLNDIKTMAEQIEDLRVRALFIIGYLTGGRVSEIVRAVRKKNINFIERDDRKIMLITMPNLKHRERHVKDIPIPFDREPELLNMFMEYLGTLGGEDYLFDIGRNQAYKLLQKYVGCNPHYLRHIRATHLVVYYDFNEHLLMQYMGWSDTRPAKAYVELKWNDILQKY